MGTFSFPKRRRLSSKKEIEALFAQGHSFVTGPLRVQYLLVGAGEGVCRMAVSVPKKKHKRAVERNLIKRRMREAFRLNYPLCLAPQVAQSGQALLFLCLYLPHETLAYAPLENAMQKVLDRLSKEISGGAVSAAH